VSALLVAGNFFGRRSFAGVFTELVFFHRKGHFPRGGLGFSWAASGAVFSGVFFSPTGSGCFGVFSGCCPLVSFSLVFSGLSSSLC